MRLLIVLSLMAFNCGAYEAHIDDDGGVVYHDPVKGLWIPSSEDNRHFKKFKKWKQAGNKEVVKIGGSDCVAILKKAVDKKGLPRSGAENCEQLKNLWKNSGI